eukprot:TRINITY_DN17124_c0_g1_i4.p2 TRINITY_DN17124_c0_g1~~TRINITY_DN17124_c0_g1_i4.p2  ORF type:complete len:140 (+),score=8.09 TRINITY_DN17124_c0_g1_i4:152-571(+)
MLQAMNTTGKHADPSTTSFSIRTKCSRQNIALACITSAKLLCTGTRSSPTFTCPQSDISPWDREELRLLTRSRADETENTSAVLVCRRTRSTSANRVDKACNRAVFATAMPKPLQTDTSPIWYAWEPHWCTEQPGAFAA